MTTRGRFASLIFLLALGVGTHETGGEWTRAIVVTGHLGSIDGDEIGLPDAGARKGA